jgi:cell division protein FtsI (penicillin-binding protein 3)
VRGPTLENPSRRVGVLRALLVVIFLALAARAAQLTVLDRRGEMRGDGQVHTTMVLAATRGLIVDRNGTELSVTLHAPSIYVSPGEIEKADQTLEKLARALGLDRRKLAARMKGRERFTYVARWASEATAERVALLDLPGVGIVREPRRAYPAGKLAASVLGFSNIDGVGVRGIEQQEDEWLRGSRHSVPVERDARGRLLAHAFVTPRDAAGGDVALTLDATLQAEAELALLEAVEKTGARGGVVISMDPHTGDILTLAEAPGFDPNEFRSVKFANTRCRAFVDAVEPGSTFKAFLVAGALEAGAISPTQLIDTGDGHMRIPGKTVRDHRPYGVLDPAGALRVSSNIAAVKMAQLLGRPAHFATLRSFGFGVSTASGFPFESRGLLRPWQEWKPVDQATVAFGQGVSVTAIQLAAATASLASGGEWHTPRLVHARRRPTGRWQQTAPGASHRVVSEQTAATVLAMMEGVVSAEGTGRRAALAGLRVAGKTGTAQKFDRTTGRYSQDRYLAWFVGVVPAEDPKLVIVVAIDEPQGPAHGGGDVAAPLFARVAASQLADMGIVTRPAPIPAARPKPVLSLEASTSKAALKQGGEDLRAAKAQQEAKTPTRAPATKPVTSAVAANERALAQPGSAARRATHSRKQSPAIDPGRPVVIPDFRGETIAAARQLAARDALKLVILGDGLAVAQDPTPGTVVSGSDKRVRIHFSDGGKEPRRAEEKG